MPTVRVLWCSIRAYGGQVLYWLGHGETEVGDAGQSSVARGGPPRSAAEGSKKGGRATVVGLALRSALGGPPSAAQGCAPGQANDKKLQKLKRGHF